MKTRAYPLFILALLAGSVLYAQSPAATSQPDRAARAADAAAKRASMLAKVGGMVHTPITGPAILFLNTQKATADADIRATVDAISRSMRLPVMFLSKDAADPLAEAATSLTASNVAAVVVVANLPGQPSLLVAPENRWVLVNCAPLGGDGVSAELRDERVQKEIWRAFGYLMGAAHSNYDFCLLKSVLTATDLDDLKVRTLSPEPFNKIAAHAKKLGMTPVRVSTYRKAVEEGWAPAPTNDAQKAIWNEIMKKAEPKQ